jgi:2-keto-4-pentenoate hydratase/2-oxohepta-3-ene-1,7-dioic acid hydratase in catechol pathway
MREGAITLKVNDQIKQNRNIRNMIWRCRRADRESFAVL